MDWRRGKGRWSGKPKPKPKPKKKGWERQTVKNDSASSYFFQKFKKTLGPTKLFSFQVPYFGEHEILDWYWVSLFLGWTIITVTSINPVIYIIFNQTIRTIVFEFLGIKKSASEVITINSDKIRASLGTVTATRTVYVVNATEV